MKLTLEVTKVAFVSRLKSTRKEMIDFFFSVGGPDEFDEFVNNRTDYVRNEVALDYNAAITSISALMLDLERGNVG